MVRTRGKRTFAHAYLMGATALVSVLSTPAFAQEAAAPAASTVGEVIVTANRREERNQDVPIAITAFSSQRLEQQNISKPQDLQASVPSLTVGAVGQGSRESQTYTLRGQGATFQASPGVVVYMNEVPLPAAITLSQQGGPGNYLDLENMQILSGPQGTLFGRNTTGGAILLVPHKPTNNFEGWVEAGYGNYDNKEVRGVVNIPVVEDKLLVRLAGEFQDRDGYTHDVTFDKNRDNVHYYTGRLGVTFRPNDRFENYLMAYGTYSNNNGTGVIHKGFNIPGLQAAGFCVDPPAAPGGIAVSCDVYRNTTALADRLGPRETALSVDEYQKTKTAGIVNTSRFFINDALTVRNIISLQKLKSEYLYDGDATPLQQYDLGPVAGHVPPGYVSTVPRNLPRDDLSEFTEELQLQGDMLDKHLIFTVGGFFYDQKPDGAQQAIQLNYCPAAFTGFCTPQQIDYGVQNQSKALYAQGTFDFGAVSPALDRLKLTLGYRYTWDRVDGFTQAYTPQADGTFICTSDNQPSLNPAGCRFDGHLRSSAPTWIVGLDYKLTDDFLVYGKVSRGYKAGGFNTYSVRESTRTFTPEFVTSYEAGFKSDWRIGDIPARLNATYYFLDYKDIQRQAGDFNTATNASGAQILKAKAHIQGVELDGAIRPLPGLELGGNFSYTHAEYTDFHYTPTVPTQDCSGGIIPTGGLADASCLPFQYVAPRIYSVHMSYTRDLPNELGSLNLFVNYSHSSSQYTEAFQLANNQPGAWIEPFGLLNASLNWNNVASKPVDLSLFVTNATDELYRISNSDVFQNGSLLTWQTIYGEPRMFGLRVRYRFGS